MKKIVYYSAGSVVAALMMAGCGGKSAGVIATVNGEAITSSDYVSYMELMPSVRVITQNGATSLPVEGSIGFQAMRDLITQQLTLQLAKDKGIFPNDSDISQEIEFQKKLKKDFLLSLQTRGLTLDMIRRSLAIDLIHERMLTKGVTVSADDVNKYIKANPDQFIEPERVSIYWVLVRSPKTEEAVDRDLASGVSFPQVASKFSEAPQAKQLNGRLLDQSTGQPPVVTGLPPAIQTLVKKMNAGDITDWVRLADGRAKFFIEKKIAAKPIPMDDTKKEYLRRILAKEKGAQARDITKEVTDKLKASDIKVIKSQFQDPWKRSMDQIKANEGIEKSTGASN